MYFPSDFDIDNFTTPEAIEKRIEKMDKIEKPKQIQTLDRGFHSGAYLAKEFVNIDAVSKSFGEKVLLMKSVWPSRKSIELRL